MDIGDDGMERRREGGIHLPERLLLIPTERLGITRPGSNNANNVANWDFWSILGGKSGNTSYLCKDEEGVYKDKGRKSQ